MFRNEACYLDEWIRFHELMGIEHFFLYDHISTDDPLSRLEPYIKAGLVTVMDWPIAIKNEAQQKAYQHCLDNFGETSRWIAFIDLDEFLFSPHRKLNDTLRDYEAYCAVVVHWQCYGSSGHRARPDGLVTDNYLYRAKTNWVRNRRVKSVVDPDRTVSPMGPHFFEFTDQALPVNENHKPVTVRKLRRPTRFINKIMARTGLFFGYFPADPYAVRAINSEDPCVDVFRINHYTVKSYEDYTNKITKNKKKRFNQVFFIYHDRNEVYGPVLKGSIKLDS